MSTSTSGIDCVTLGGGALLFLFFAVEATGTSPSDDVSPPLRRREALWRALPVDAGGGVDDIERMTMNEIICWGRRKLTKITYLF